MTDYWIKEISTVVYYMVSNITFFENLETVAVYFLNIWEEERREWIFQLPGIFRSSSITWEGINSPTNL